MWRSWARSLLKPGFFPRLLYWQLRELLHNCDDHYCKPYKSVVTLFGPWSLTEWARWKHNTSISRKSNTSCTCHQLTPEADPWVDQEDCKMHGAKLTIFLRSEVILWDKVLWWDFTQHKTFQWYPGCNKTPVRLPGASKFLCGASRSPWQLAHWASKAEPETLKCTHLVTPHDNISSLLEDDLLLSFRVRENTEERNPGK